MQLVIHTTPPRKRNIQPSLSLRQPAETDHEERSKSPVLRRVRDQCPYLTPFRLRDVLHPLTDSYISISTSSSTAFSTSASSVYSSRSSSSSSLSTHRAAPIEDRTGVDLLYTLAYDCSIDNAHESDLSFTGQASSLAIEREKIMAALACERAKDGLHSIFFSGGWELCPDMCQECTNFGVTATDTDIFKRRISISRILVSQDGRKAHQSR